MSFKSILFFFILLLFNACGEDDNPTNPTTPTTPPADLPKLSINNASVAEGDEGQETLTLTITVDGAYEGDIKVDVSTADGSALAGMDYMPLSEKLTITSPATSLEVTVPIVSDAIKEGNEHFLVQLNNPVNATIATANGRGLIQNDDSSNNAPEEGYSTPDTYNFWKTKWADEFNGETVNTDDWTFEIGNGCDKGLCGWGNNELQGYTDRPENVRIENGNLVIEAKQEGTTSYSSTRMITQDKQELRFGRIDIRAKLPKGQGVWPAIWMLGANIDSRGWPGCGEIDIMELVGHEPKKVHGTVHYGRPSPDNKFTGGSSVAPKDDFSERFHVFTLVWHPNALYWYVDDFLYFEITPDKLGNEQYPFNNDFFFIMNVAVGGNWPGNPDETTVFPQRMEVDYIRVFERE